MASVQYNKMLTDRVLSTFSDIRPWGGVSPIFDLEARVESMNRGAGASFDVAQLSFPENNFGVEQTFFLPVIIKDVTTSRVLYRGFVVSNSGRLDASGEAMSCTCQCYKWLLSKRTSIRGKWYLNKGEISAPAGGMGSGLTAGDGKYTYEKFRSDLQSGSGFLQNEQLVFNQGGSPDCFQDNVTSGTTLAFYKDTVDEQEEMGLPDSQFAQKPYNGYYWTWVTMLRYIHTYFIDPYNAALAPVNLNATDLTALSNIDEGLRQPINFSLDGYNPLMAIDYLVSSIPGRWYWYMEYTTTTTTIRIRELKSIVPDQVALTMNNAGECLTSSDANVTSFTVKRDGSEAVANVVGLGGKLKLVTTIKLVPTWPRTIVAEGVVSDFESDADYQKWKRWSIQERKLEKTGQIADNISLSAEEELRYPLIYRVYGVAREGELLGDLIVSTASFEDGPEDIIDLDGDVGTHYTNFTVPGSGLGATLRDFYFQNAAIEREISPPEFERFSDKIQVFMYDNRFDSVVVTDSDGNTVPKAPRNVDDPAGATDAEKLADQNRRRWIIPSIDKISYNFDQKNMQIEFDQPQPKQYNSFSLSNKEKFAKTIKENSYDGIVDGLPKIVSREVYMTATFSTDLAAVFGSRISGGFVETINGAPFSAYVKARNQDIIYHANAWYPQTQLNKTSTNPIDSTDTMDGKTLGSAIAKCDSFDNYRKYVGEGHYELGRAILTWKEGYLNYREDITAELPYMEIDDELGDGLIGIANSGYINIGSYLIGISWSRAGDSDSMITSYVLNNYYRTDRSNIDFAPLKHNENKNRFNKRVKFEFINEVASGALPPI